MGGFDDTPVVFLALRKSGCPVNGAHTHPAIVFALKQHNPNYMSDLREAFAVP